MSTDQGTAENSVFTRYTESYGGNATWRSGRVAGDAAPATNRISSETGAAVVARETRQKGAADAVVDPRHLGRELAARTPESEIKRLFNEHRQLARKKVTVGITAAEERRLQMVRWNLDRVEDAQVGHALDDLERAAVAHEDLAAEVAAFVRELRVLGRR